MPAAVPLRLSSPAVPAELLLGYRIIGEGVGRPPFAASLNSTKPEEHPASIVDPFAITVDPKKRSGQLRRRKARVIAYDVFHVMDEHGFIFVIGVSR